MEYIIEGTIKELSFDEKFFTIAGTEGYAIKQKKDSEEIMYNVLHPKDNMPSKEKGITSYILSQDFKFSAAKSKCLLLQSLSLGKRIRMTIKTNDSTAPAAEFTIDGKEISLTLLAW